MTTTTILSDNGVSSGSAGIKTTGGNDGTLVLQTTTSGGTATTAVSIDTSQNTTVAGNLTFSGSAKRITGDFSNATLANRVFFQTSTANGNTVVGVIPNGTGLVAGSYWLNNSDPTNAGAAYLRASTTDITFQSTISGTGTYLPMTFYTGGSERMRIDTSGNVLVTNPAGLGYGTGSGGTVTQATNKGTPVTLNKPCGSITMNNAALGPGATVAFYCNNSIVGAFDFVGASIAAVQSGSYTLKTSCDGGHIYFAVTNTTAGSLSDAVIINFAIIKVATA